MPTSEYMQALWAEVNAYALWNAILSLISGLGGPWLCTGLASQYLVSEEHDWLAHRSGRQGSVGVTHVLGESDRFTRQEFCTNCVAKLTSSAAGNNGFQGLWVLRDNICDWMTPSSELHAALLAPIIPACISHSRSLGSLGKNPKPGLSRECFLRSDLRGVVLKRILQRGSGCLSSHHWQGILLCVEGFREIAPCHPPWRLQDH